MRISLRGLQRRLSLRWFVVLALVTGALVAAGLIAATGLRLITALRRNVMGALACWSFATITFIAIGLLRIPLAWVLLAAGAVAWSWAYRQLGRINRRPGAP